jgi:hypothetical protein
MRGAQCARNARRRPVILGVRHEHNVSPRDRKPPRRARRCSSLVARRREAMAPARPTWPHEMVYLRAGIPHPVYLRAGMPDLAVSSWSLHRTLGPIYGCFRSSSRRACDRDALWSGPSVLAGRPGQRRSAWATPSAQYQPSSVGGRRAWLALTTCLAHVAQERRLDHADV